MAADNNAMREVRLDKVVLNIGIGNNDQLLPNAKALLKKLTGNDAVATTARKRDPTLKLRKGQTIGAMVTLRGEKAADILRKTLDAKNNAIRMNGIANNSLNFGIHEYIDISGLKYDHKIGMMGMNVNASFRRMGRRVELRKRRRARIARVHRDIAPEEILGYLEKNFNAKMEE